MPLTISQIKSVKPTGKTQKLFDGKGMYLEVTPKGKTYWRLKYRINGKEKRISLGVYPDVSLKVAREKRRDARKLISDGVDPSAARKAEKLSNQERAGNSFEAIAREWFSKNESSWAEAYSSKIIRRLEMYVFPWLGAKPISDIGAPDLLPVIRRIEDRGTRETAHRTLSLCGQVFRYAVATARTDRDCTADLKGALRPAKGKHFAATTDPKRLGGILRAIDGLEATPIVQAALRLAPLVFVRPGELRQARWEDIDLDAAEWRFTVTKTDTDHIVPLSAQAIEILRELQPITGNRPLVFPNLRSPRDERAMSDAALTAAMRRIGIAKQEMTVHGFRAVARTLLDEELGFRPELIEHQLAHLVKDPLGRAYNRTKHLPERKEMMQAWADYLDELKSRV